MKVTIKLKQGRCMTIKLWQWLIIRTPHSEFGRTREISRELRHNPMVIHFSNRVIPIWNSLPNHVVSAETVNTFKQRLDKFWIDQDVMYNYKADIHGIGNRIIV